MSELKILILEKPVTWARPGQATGKARIHRYDSQKQIKIALGLIIKRQLGNHKRYSGPVSLDAIFYFPIPKSVKGITEGDRHIGKKDIDNLLKFYLDLCKDCGVYWDDSQVSDVRMSKCYGVCPRVELTFNG